LLSESDRKRNPGVNPPLLESPQLACPHARPVMRQPLRRGAGHCANSIHFASTRNVSFAIVITHWKLAPESSVLSLGFNLGLIMQRTSRLRSLTLAFCAVWTTLCRDKTLTAQDQSPQPDQIETVGRKYHLDPLTDTNVATTTTVADRLLRTTSDTMKYEFSADVITLAMSPNNWVTRKRLPY
jgi:hypothetical protein